jgi:hypothetical protein
MVQRPFDDWDLRDLKKKIISLDMIYFAFFNVLISNCGSNGA